MVENDGNCFEKVIKVVSVVVAIALCFAVLKSKRYVEDIADTARPVVEELKNADIFTEESLLEEEQDNGIR